MSPTPTEEPDYWSDHGQFDDEDANRSDQSSDYCSTDSISGEEKSKFSRNVNSKDNEFDDKIEESTLAICKDGESDSIWRISSDFK